MGRKKINPTSKSTVVACVRLTPEEHQQAIAFARSQGSSLSAWLRKYILGAIPAQKDAP